MTARLRNGCAIISPRILEQTWDEAVRAIGEADEAV
jgi:hypothetical protein